MQPCTAYHGPVVAFDLDDTLFSERDFAHSGFRAAGSLLASTFGDTTDWAALMIEAFERGENPFDSLAPELEARGATLAGLLPRLLDAYRSHLPEISLRHGSAELLDALRARGVRMALITDGRSLTQRNKIRALGLEQYFAPEMIFISEEVGADKLSGEAMERVVRAFPEARQFIYVGDNPAKDFYAANRRGWTTLCLADDGSNIHPQTFRGGFYDPSAIISALQEVACLTE